MDPPTHQETGFMYILGEGFLCIGMISLTNSALLCVHLTFLFDQLRKSPDHILFRSTKDKKRFSSGRQLTPVLSWVFNFGWVGVGNRVNGDRFSWIESFESVIIFSETSLNAPDLQSILLTFFWTELRTAVNILCHSFETSGAARGRQWPCVLPWWICGIRTIAGAQWDLKQLTSVYQSLRCPGATSV